jgi:sugar/nucleoside kinase (ribokinase family)
MGADGHAVAACSADDRELLLSPLEGFGLPVTWVESGSTTAYSFHYEGDQRIMRQDAVGHAWSPEATVEAAGEAPWVDVCALVRTHFPPETLAALARDGRKVLIDAQGLVRRPDLGSLQTDGEIGDALRHVTVLKLNDEEANTLVGSIEPERLRDLEVPEVLVTFGSFGSYVVTPELIEHVPAEHLGGEVDPTGAGDTFSVAYLVARLGGAEPVEAARAATTAAAAFLTG